MSDEQCQRSTAPPRDPVRLDMTNYLEDLTKVSETHSSTCLSKYGVRRTDMDGLRQTTLELQSVLLAISTLYYGMS